MSAQSDEPRVRYDRLGPLACLTLNRPGKLNAIDDAMVRALLDALDTAEADDDVRLVVLRGEGRAFSAGFDLEESAPEPAPGLDALETELRRDFDMVMRFWDCPKPTLAVLHGVCLGGAFELALACDLAVASEDCRLGEPEVRFGSGVVALLLPWVCGARTASEILLAGEDRLSGTRAEVLGIVNHAVPAVRLEETALELALRVARNDPHAVARARRALKAGYDAAGLREALAEGLRQCIAVERHPSEQSVRFRTRVRELGTAGAAAWLDEQLDIDTVKAFP